MPAYTGRLLDRFDNTALHHKTAQIATDASLKVPQRIVAPLQELRAAGRPCGLLVFALAAWVRSCLGFDDKGREMPMSDPQMQTWAGRPGPDLPSAQIAQAFVRFAPVFGPKDDLALAADIASALQDIRQHGILAAAQMRIADKS